MATAAADTEVSSQAKGSRPEAASPPTPWLTLLGLPTGAVLLASQWPAWAFMWTLAFAIYAALKWQTAIDAATTLGVTRKSKWAYLLLWPGMNARSFLSPDAERPQATYCEGLWAIVKLLWGVWLIVLGVTLASSHPLLAGWIGMTGIVFALHFGVGHVLSVLWRQAGYDAPPIMEAPVLASSLSDFWGRRWNLAFRDWAHQFVFLPLTGRLGAAGATMMVFVVSGVIHDAVISTAAGSGFGLPTAYFLLQGLGVMFERSEWGRRLGVRRGWRGRVFCALLTMAPVGLLFHPPFIKEVITPMLLAWEDFLFRVLS